MTRDDVMAELTAGNAIQTSALIDKLSAAGASPGSGMGGEQIVHQPRPERQVSLG